MTEERNDWLEEATPGDWIDHDPAVETSPVDGELYVEVEFYGDAVGKPRKAKNWSWGGVNSYSIKRYRVVPKP